MNAKPVRVLYSFPHKIGADRICYIAWQQVNGLAAAGANMLVFPGVLHKPFMYNNNIEVSPTLSRGKLRTSYKIMGTVLACTLHDYIVSRRLEKLAGRIDIIHAWPLGAEKTLKTAARLGIPSVLERPNAHTRFAYAVVRQESERLGVRLPSNYEHAYNGKVLAKEEREYSLAHKIICPSEFVVQTFLDQGIPGEKLVRHIYGVDEKRFQPGERRASAKGGLVAIFVGLCAVRKGLHFALEAWLKSSASQDGTFLIAGDFLPAYAERLAPMLRHSSIRVLGHQTGVDELMRKSDIMMLPSIEEGFGLVCTEAMASGCVPLVSNACTEICRHMENSLVHRIADVDSLAEHITLLHKNPSLLDKLRDGALRTIPEVTWTKAGAGLLKTYRKIIHS